MSDVFVSYSNTDRPRVRLLVEALQQQGWSVWWDRKIPVGESWDRMIETAIGAAKCVVVVWSEASVKSTWVRIEANHALRRDILVPVVIDDVDIPLAFSLVQTAKLVGWSGDTQHPEFVNLVSAVTKHMGQPGGVERDRATSAREADQDDSLLAGLEQLLADSAKDQQEPPSEDTDQDLLEQLDKLLG